MFLSSDLSNLGNDLNNVLLENTNNPFWINVITNVILLCSVIKSTLTMKLRRCPFYIIVNSNITIGGKTITSSVLANKRLFCVHQLKVKERFMSQQEFNLKYELTINFLLYRSRLNALNATFQKSKQSIHYKQFTQH